MKDIVLKGYFYTINETSLVRRLDCEGTIRSDLFVLYGILLTDFLLPFSLPKKCSSLFPPKAT